MNLVNNPIYGGSYQPWSRKRINYLSIKKKSNISAIETIWSDFMDFWCVKWFWATSWMESFLGRMKHISLLTSFYLSKWYHALDTLTHQRVFLLSDPSHHPSQGQGCMCPYILCSDDPSPELQLRSVWTVPRCIF